MFAFTRDEWGLIKVFLETVFVKVMQYGDFRANLFPHLSADMHYTGAGMRQGGTPFWTRLKLPSGLAVSLWKTIRIHPQKKSSDVGTHVFVKIIYF